MLENTRKQQKQPADAAFTATAAPPQRGNAMQSMNFLIKPVSGLCNMRCRYCFYEDETAHRETANAGVMTAELAEGFVRETFAALDTRGQVTFAFQGGEPTLAGLDYFRRFTALVDKYNTKRARVSYAIQTNGLAVDAQWAAFFAEHHFLVGLSLDGDKAIHDALRPDAADKATWNRATKALALLQKNGVEVNLLCVVSRRCAKSPVKVYHSLQKLGGAYLQFIPCLDPLEAARGSMAYSLTPELYGSFLCALFDEWYRDWKAGRYTSVRLFDDYVHLAMGLPAGSCAASGHCGAYCVVEGDGTLYPCDFYCLDAWRLGKLGDQPLQDCLNGETERRFLAQGEARPAACTACPYQPLCNGGCKRDWYADETGNHNYYCPSLRAFFAHAAPRLAEIARAELAARR